MAVSPDHRVLVPVDVLGGESVPQRLVDVLASVPVVVLAYREIPDQVGTDQARDQYADRARSKLADLRTAFEDAGCPDVSTRLVFTHDRLRTFERIALEEGCTAVVLLNPAPVLESVLVAVRGDVHLEHIAALLSAVLAGTDLAVTFFHVVDEEGDRQQGEAILEDATEALVAAGVDRGRIETRVAVDGSPSQEIIAAADDHDLLVVGESRPSVRRVIFRDRAKTLARGTVDPVLVIRGEYLEQDEDDDSNDGGPAESSDDEPT
ncbi:universal stress protein [Halopiger goleimassiliensis]|uniref:universal stress protein n=1 Tax=Halopiger goleimassiliensis TaxID=1293048 RepID=UPI0006775D55|nr:universal stress protein [Halopiger goleimassiliensis]